MSREFDLDDTSAYEPPKPFSRQIDFKPPELRDPWVTSNMCSSRTLQRYHDAVKRNDERRQAKFDRKYMKVARALAKDNTACYSRHIGVVLIGEHGRPLSFGYNGSVEGAPHNDSAEYLTYLWDVLLRDVEKSCVSGTHGTSEKPIGTSEQFAAKFAGCKTCPRRLVGVPSGERLELCNCAHAERNALANAGIAGVSTVNSTMYLWGTVPCIPCHECALQIVQQKVKRVVCLKSSDDYSTSTRGLFIMTGVVLDEITDEWIGE